ncbi:hypothetical protein EYZ11_006530 [Aspergillus tanneri]|uniref:DUF4484 domain-containing protein n=1 Tax=Aspergillus tanneri TaxID=1220188 RepID=A0A4S3JF92_9EURO|nr:hypothetical protein EYZ11_006530 [Aspergillus tanneri]
MAPGSSRRKPLGLDVPRTSAFESPPPIAALFVIRFDIKAGYVISWKRTAPGVELEGIVEYKSLPSGLHNISEDLVYFVHEQYAGISAFVNQPAEEAERNAKMFAVGVLVPLSCGRLGKSWRHAPKLKELALNYAQDMSETQPLSDYWTTYEIHDGDSSGLPPPDSPVESPLNVRLRAHGERSDNGNRRSRAFSDAIVLETPRPGLTPFHPASSLPDFLDCFGPLLFPLYRAALLRKRILFMGEVPVYMPCNYENHFVGASPDSDRDATWIACSTDTVLTMKSELFDVLVTLPPPHSKNAAEKVYPKISVLPTTTAQHNSSQAVHLKATQRDARRYSTLRKGLQQVSRDEDTQSGDDDDDDDESDAASTFSSSSIVEPLSWARLAYTSFIWWASAGEKRDGLSEEEEEEHQIKQDTRLLASVESLPSPPSGSLGRRTMPPGDPVQQPPEIALVAYFRRLTTQIFVALSDVIVRHDSRDAANSGELNDDDEIPYEDDPDDGLQPSATIGRRSTQEDDSTSPLLQRSAFPDPDLSRRDDKPIKITTEDMTEMGLDVWSAADRIFVEELVQTWWGRKACVDSARIRCCGISIL